MICHELLAPGGAAQQIENLRSTQVVPVVNCKKTSRRALEGLTNKPTSHRATVAAGCSTVIAAVHQ